MSKKKKAKREVEITEEELAPYCHACRADYIYSKQNGFLIMDPDYVPVEKTCDCKPRCASCDELIDRPPPI